MAQHLSDLLQKLPALRQAQALAGLQRHFDAVLAERFRGEALVVALEDDELLVLCSNGAIASRLRLDAQSLADSLQQRGLAVRRVSIKVRPATTRKPPAPRNKAGLSATAQQALASAAGQMEEGEVKAALQKLLKHHQGS